MKRIFLLLGLGAMLLLASCAGLPAPQTPQESLVVGSFVLDFPDSFFDRAPRTIDTQVELDFRDITKGTSFPIFTSNGRFWFVASGSDEYVLDSSEFSSWMQSHGYHVGNREIGLRIPTAPGKILDLGDIRLVYRNPQASGAGGITYRWYNYETEASLIPSTSPVLLADMTVRDWIFDVSMSRQSEKSALADFLKQVDQSGAWRDREVIDCTIPS
jgi:hypothetical protein